jgi:hypothetical protein
VNEKWDAEIRGRVETRIKPSSESGLTARDACHACECEHEANEADRQSSRLAIHFSSRLQILSPQTCSCQNYRTADRALGSRAQQQKLRTAYNYGASSANPLVRFPEFFHFIGLKSGLKDQRLLRPRTFASVEDFMCSGFSDQKDDVFRSAEKTRAPAL